MLYGALLRFYLPVVKISALDEMTEDLIELVTSLTIGEQLSPWLLRLCRLSQREDEQLLQEKLKELGSLLPEQVGIGEFFTLNDSSRLIGMLKEVKNELQIKDLPSAALAPKMQTESTAVEETTVEMVEDIADDRTDMDEFCNSIRESSAFDNDSIMDLQTMVMPTSDESLKAA